MKSRCRDLRGFSLIELMIASAIMAAAGGLLMSSLITANRGTALRAEQAVLGQVLASQLAQVDEPLASNQGASGSLPRPFEDRTWQLTIDDAPQPSLRQAALSVEHGTQHLELITWRHPHDDQQP